MARQNQVVEVNSFVKGLITEASPLTFPENASLDEDNFNLRRDGSRDRRLGMDLEEGAVDVVTGIPSSTTEIAFSTYTWGNVGGVPSRTYIVVQTGGTLRVFDPDQSPISSGLVHTESLGVADITQPFSYANIDGDLVVVTGDKEIGLLSYDGTSFSLRKDYIRVRDQWGVEDVVGGKDLFSAEGLSTRPATLPNTHLYNLRNQTFGPAKERGGEGHTLRDTIEVFSNDHPSGDYPSNSDNINYVMYPNPNNDQNRTGDQFYSEDLIGNPPGSFPAPKGHFIIDALERGKSRLEQEQSLRGNYPALVYGVSNLPTDATPGGPRTVAEYSGRVWYAGFEGTVVDGDARSPVLSSYVFYSQLVNDPSQIVNCYQEGDPTSKESPDLLDTDGGFIRVDGAYNIQALVSVGTGILVLAENGIWMISGGSDYGFSANNNMRRKISERGIQSPGSVVSVDNTVMFWADDGIYQIGPDQFGDYTSTNMTQNTIQKFYDDIPPEVKLDAKGNYDSYDQKVRWVYYNRIGDTEPARELIFDLNLGAFYTHTISTLDGNSYPRVVSPIEVPPFRLNEDATLVINEGEPVVNDGEDVTQTISVRGSGTRELAYMVITGIDNLTYSFARYRNGSFKDWESVDGIGVDAPAYLVTGYLSGGDFMRYKQAPYVQFYFTRTENGFVDDGTGNLVPTNQSGCLVQSQWEWANSANSNRWGRTFQAYRYKRLYMPTGAQDEFDSGFEVITTKNKLRGKGKVLSLKISTEPEKDCRLLGWSMLVGVTGNV
tara:strand:+ start:14486 stop:16801 length:2316 start_codon:yes stop_codon:yes gene_type:complete